MEEARIKREEEMANRLAERAAAKAQRLAVSTPMKDPTPTLCLARSSCTTSLAVIALYTLLVPAHDPGQSLELCNMRARQNLPWRVEASGRQRIASIYPHQAVRIGPGNQACFRRHRRSNFSPAYDMSTFAPFTFLISVYLSTIPLRKLHFRPFLFIQPTISDESTSPRRDALLYECSVLTY
ncbi:hypothetical protein OF83DRAFT_1173541 [Amylostereum chailletii]|nr:hypothetical protein OF83DRAFT_1173541 [Amylostereum chailletii]